LAGPPSLLWVVAEAAATGLISGPPSSSTIVTSGSDSPPPLNTMVAVPMRIRSPTLRDATGSTLAVQHHDLAILSEEGEHRSVVLDHEVMGRHAGGPDDDVVLARCADGDHLLAQLVGEF
jgi:hypothetical protein